MIQNIEPEFAKQIRQELIDIPKLVEQLNNMCMDDKRFYRDTIILSVLINTTDTPEEALGNLDILKKAIMDNEDY